MQVRVQTARIPLLFSDQMFAEDSIQKLAVKLDNFGITIHFYEYLTSHCIKTHSAKANCACSEMETQFKKLISYITYIKIDSFALR